jgi:hypothetical protein
MASSYRSPWACNTIKRMIGFLRGLDSLTFASKVVGLTNSAASFNLEWRRWLSFQGRGNGGMNPPQTFRGIHPPPEIRSYFFQTAIFGIPRMIGIPGHARSGKKHLVNLVG